MRPEQCVYVIDDDLGARMSLRLLLAASGFDAREFADPQVFLGEVARLPVGCVITDMRMPAMSGLDLMLRLKALGAPHPIIVITGHADVAMAVKAMKSGALDFLEKPFSEQDLLRAVRLAIAAKPSEGADAARRRAAALLAALTRRETDVLLGLLAGKSNKLIARDLGIGPRTVEDYRANLMEKTGVRGLAELVQLALLAEFPAPRLPTHGETPGFPGGDRQGGAP